MAEYKTPGVYIEEISAFPNSVVGVATAVPAFIGYTEKAQNGRLNPSRITSLGEFTHYFGGAPAPVFTLGFREKGEPLDPLQGATIKAPGGGGGGLIDLKRLTPAFALYDSMRLFFSNGGGACYVVSVGGYADQIEAGPLLDGLLTLEKVGEPTLLVAPETTRLNPAGSAKVQQAMLAQAGTMRDRFAILDIHRGWLSRQDDAGDPVESFRSGIGSDHLGFGAAYYPWLRATINEPRDFSLADFAPDQGDALADLLKDQPLAVKPKSRDAVLAEIEKLRAPPEDLAPLDKILRIVSPLYHDMLAAMAEAANFAAPGGLMAGIYTSADNSRGVWNAPANVSVSAISDLTTPLEDAAQEDLNAPVSGRSINAFRNFSNRGDVLVWGARTLDGNSTDWRYIAARRTAIMLEQSIKLAVASYVFEPNDANTWVVIRGMVENFLTGIWKQGGLAGARPADAFQVRVGLGQTMTAIDVLEGRLRLSVLVAMVRPAEFIEISFEQAMQKN
ncbi:MAG: phage tail sheath C-terminal domain-containing protein [Paracoccaceae bacterium]